MAAYHAPAPALPSPAWNLYQRLRAPWRVNYPHQWFWDSTAHAIVLSHLDPGLAREEIRSLLYAQREDGFIPHLIWNLRHRHWVEFLLHRLYPHPCCSPYLQPPNIAEAVQALFEATGDTSFLAEVLPALTRFYLYIGRERNPSADGLPEIIISYESGKDRSPEYDLVYGESNAKAVWMGPMLKLMVHHSRQGWDAARILASGRFRVKDVLFDCVYAVNLSVMARLWHAAGDESRSRYFRDMALHTEAAILSRMYHASSGLYYSLDSRPGREALLLVPTVSSLFPLLLETIPLERVEELVGHLSSPGQFWTPYPVPAEPGVKPVAEDVIWRGSQTWVYPNWYLVRGLRFQAERFPQRRESYLRIANEITARTLALVRREGFREFYHSYTGRGMRARHFGWSTLVLDMVSTLVPLGASPAAKGIAP